MKVYVCRPSGDSKIARQIHKHEQTEVAKSEKNPS